MTKHITVLLAAAAMTALPGCWFTGAYWTGGSDDDVVVDGWYDSGDRSVTFQRLDGELGGHQLALAEASGTAYAGFGTTMEVETIQDGTWLLFRLDVGADLYDPELADGVVYSSTTDQVDLMGCTGDAPYEFDYDGYAREVEVEVFPGAVEGTRQVDFTATFDDGLSERQVTGTVVLDMNDDGGATSWRGGATSGRTYSATWEGVTSDLGDQGAFALSAVEGSGYSDGYYSSLELETTEPGQWVLFRLSSYEQDLFTAEPGDVIEGGELMGCTGNSPGSFDYDGYASDVTVEILPGSTASERIARVRGSFDTEWGTQEVDGTVRYQVY